MSKVVVVEGHAAGGASDASHAAPDAPAAPRKKGGAMKMVVVALVGLVLLGGAGVGAWLLAPRFLGHRGGAAGDSRVAEPKVSVALGSLIVNLAGEPRHFLKVAVSLGVPGPKEAKELEEARPQLLDLLIGVLSSADAATVASEDGRAKLKATVLGRVHQELHLAEVSRVYFTEFVVQ